MCGIICEISSAEFKSKDPKLRQLIGNRGPDCNYCLEKQIDSGLKLFFYGAVLWMQGVNPTSQPVENEDGVLLFNGDIYDEKWDKAHSDTQIISDKLRGKEKDEDIISLFKTLKGPFSLIYYVKKNHDIYFTRDKIGRNSLLFHKSEYSIIISSVLNRNYKCVEIPATQIYKLNAKSNKIKLNPWSNGLIEEYALEDWLSMLINLQSIPDDQLQLECNTPQLDDNNEVVNHIVRSAKESKCYITIMSSLLENGIIRETVNKIKTLLEKSLQRRIETQPNKCQQCISNASVACNHCTVGILFSGGLDCSILALVADKYVNKEQPIELINVAFKKDSHTNYDVPDRVTGRKSYEELKKLCPLRIWIFREANIPKEELDKHQISVIADLVHPRHTILDESLGSALWFAARGKDNQNNYTTCRILLTGSGADELFGGYMRHRNAYKRHGWSGLYKELQFDWNRISYRNLARDNRVICDHGRQSRMPYLDEDLTDYVLNLKPWLKCFPSEHLGPGIGDKLMLRLVALDLGLQQVVNFPKRALQFGSRIANKKENGSDISRMFLNTLSMK